MKKLIVALIFIWCLKANAQIKFSSQEKTPEGESVFTSQFDTRLKLNGYFNRGGNNAASQTLNLTSANPYNRSAETGFDMNMLQSQFANKTVFNGLKGGPLTIVVEGQYWGPPGDAGNFQLRQAYVEYHHFRLGQGWTFFGGDAPSWYNTLEWEGPIMGVWTRHVQLKYFTRFGKDKSFGLEAGIESSIPHLAINNKVRSQNFSSGGQAIPVPAQSLPDFIIALSNRFGKTSVRLSALYRPIKYADGKNGETKSTAGGGIHVNSKTLVGAKSCFMAQVLVGTGIGASYTLGSYFGNNAPGNGPDRLYDAIYDQHAAFKTVPFFGVSAGAEIFFGNEKRMHSNTVLGYATQRYHADPHTLTLLGLVEDNTKGDFVRLNKQGSTVLAYPSGTINIMYDILKDVKVEGLPLNFTIGLEYNVGAKIIINDITQSATVNRIAFGLMLGF